MSAFAVGTPPRNNNNNHNHNQLKQNNVIYNNKENTVNYYERNNSNRGRTSSSFDGEIRRRQDLVYHSTPERSGSKQKTPSPESRSRMLRRSHSVMAYSPTRQAKNSTLMGGKRVSAPSPHRSNTYASMEEMFSDRSNALQDIGNTRSFEHIISKFSRAFIIHFFQLIGFINKS